MKQILFDIGIWLAQVVGLLFIILVVLIAAMSIAERIQVDRDIQEVEDVRIIAAYMECEPLTRQTFKNIDRIEEMNDRIENRQILNQSVFDFVISDKWNEVELIPMKCMEAK